MRAFKGDINGGPVWLDQDHVEGMHFGQPAEAYAAEWALREASRILGETEEAPIPLLFWWEYITREVIAEEYLAESLAHAIDSGVFDA